MDAISYVDPAHAGREANDNGSLRMDMEASARALFLADKRLATPGI